jgi:uncharacterized membrane protein
LNSFARGMEGFGDTLGRFFTRHWLGLMNGVLLVITGLSILAPYLEHAGHPIPGLLIYKAFRLLCHQKPERCFFVFGHQMAVCSRCFSVYASFLLIGLAFAAWRALTQRHWEEIPLWMLGVLAIPMALDGVTQLVGWRESTQVLRTITGTLVGAGVGLFVFPFLGRAFQEAGSMGKGRMQVADKKLGY